MWNRITFSARNVSIQGPRIHVITGRIFFGAVWNMSFMVRQAGMMSLLVDGGRLHSRSLGVPVGGAADRGALSLGNALVGNPQNLLALEITLSGPALEATQPVA